MTYSFPEPDDDGLDGYEVAVGSCDYCDGGWAEHTPTPTPHGPHYTYSQCRYCDGAGVVEIEMLPLSIDDLADMCGDHMELLP